MNRTGLTVHTVAFDEADWEHRRLINRTKRTYYMKLITDAAGDQGALFSITDNLLQKDTDMPYLLTSRPLT